MGCARYNKRMAEQDTPSLAAETGRHVEVEMVYEGGEVEQLSLDIVPDAAADFARGMLGESTPLARAIHGHAAGSVIPYHEGDALQVRVLAVSGGLLNQPVDLTKRRQETERKAIRRSDQTNLIIFASSVNNKWGDYDPGAIQEDDEDRPEEEG